MVGPPATATALAAGTAANTVIWYQGDDQSPSARFTAQSKVDTSVTVGVGAQANEEGIRRLMVNLAVFANESFTSSTTDQGRYQALNMNTVDSIFKLRLIDVRDWLIFY